VRFPRRHANASVLLFNLDGDEDAWARLTPGVDAPAGCGEDFVNASPAWCGGKPPDSVVRWSNDGDLLLLRSSAPSCAS